MRYQIKIFSGKFRDSYSIKISGENISSLMYNFINLNFESNPELVELNQENITETIEALFSSLITNGIDYIVIGSNKYKIDKNFEYLFMDFLTRCEYKLDLSPYLRDQTPEKILDSMFKWICENYLFDFTGGYTDISVID